MKDLQVKFIDAYNEYIDAYNEYIKAWKEYFNNPDFDKRYQPIGFESRNGFFL